MHFGSAVELYLSMLGWHLYNGVWSLIAESGLAILPFIIVIIKTLIESAQKKNKTQDGSIILQNLELPIYLMLFVVLVAFVPLINLHLENMTETTLECKNESDSPSFFSETQEIVRQGSTTSIGRTDTTYDNDASLILTLENRIPRAPVWWYFFHNVSQAVAISLTHALPCNPDLRALRADVNHLGINDQLLRDETSQFLRDCWRPAANKYFREQPTTTTPDIDDDITWAGSTFFLTAPGYYNHFFANEGLTSFPYDYGPGAYKSQPTAELAENRVSPFCHHWWENPTYGLRERLIEDVNIYFNKKSSLSGYADAVKAWFNNDREEMENALLRTALSAETRLSSQKVSNSYTRGNQGAGFGLHSVAEATLQATATLGIASKSFGSATEAHIFRYAAPIIQAIVLMLFICILPILILLSLYSLESVITLTITLFSIVFWTFLFALAYWLDNFLLSALQSAGSNGSTMLGLLNPINSNNHSPALDIITWITRFMYIALPFIFTTFMGIVTGRATSGLGSSVADLGGSSARAGASGASTAQSAVTGGRG